MSQVTHQSESAARRLRFHLGGGRNVRTVNSAYTWPLRKGHRKKPVAVSGTLCSDNGDVLHAWCLAGLGILLRETWDIHEELRDGRLVHVLPEWEATPSKISIVRARREPVPRRLTAFSDFLFDRWQEAPWDQ